MAWSTIYHESRSLLNFIQGILNARYYINQILQSVVLPFFDCLLKTTSQQRNARPHTAKITKKFLEKNKIQILCITYLCS